MRLYSIRDIINSTEDTPIKRCIEKGGVVEELLNDLIEERDEKARAHAQHVLGRVAEKVRKYETME